jgi:hypothetical protein
MTAQISEALFEAFSARVLGRPEHRVLVSIATGFQVRQFVHSGVINSLVENGCSVVVVSPNAPGEGFAAELPAKTEVHALDLKQADLMMRERLERRV